MGNRNAESAGDGGVVEVRGRHQLDGEGGEHLDVALIADPQQVVATRIDDERGPPPERRHIERVGIHAGTIGIVGRLEREQVGDRPRPVVRHTMQGLAHVRGRISDRTGRGPYRATPDRAEGRYSR
jgi:hypothetical protein